MDRVLNPVITRDGGISCEGEISFSAGEKYVFENRYNNFMIKTKIVTAKLFNDAGIIGAAGITGVAAGLRVQLRADGLGQDQAAAVGRHNRNPLLHSLTLTNPIINIIG